MKTQQTSHRNNGISKLSAAPYEVGLSAKGLACIRTAAQQFIDDGQLAGAVTVVARRGRIAHLETYGMIDIEANKPMQRDTIFRIYSMTKPIAAAAVMMLCEEGNSNWTFRIRFNYTGIRPEDPKVYAIYVEKAQTS